MQKKFLKVILISFITILFILSVRLMAVEDSVVVQDDDATPTSEEGDTANNEEQSSDEENTDEEDDDIDSQDENDDDDAVVENTSYDDDVGSTGPSSNETSNRVTSGTYVPPQTSMPSDSYSTVTPIPEANLSLNNILNVILIAVGVVLILFAIAILIRLK